MHATLLEEYTTKAHLILRILQTILIIDHPNNQSGILKKLLLREAQVRVPKKQTSFEKRNANRIVLN